MSEKNYYFQMVSKVVNLLRFDSHTKTQVLRHELAKYVQLFRAKQKALEGIDGNHVDCYKLVPK